jgi:hypothetical protein
MDESAARYQALLNEDLSAEQRALTQYNLSSILVELGRWEEAEVLLQGLLAQSELPRDLKRRSALNHAVLKLRQALEWMEEQEQPRWEEIIDNLKQGEEALALALSVEQEALMQEGKDFEAVSAEIEGLNRSLHHARVLAEEGLARYQENARSLPQQLEAVRAVLGSAKDRLEGLGLSQASSGLQESYLNAYVEEARQIVPLWDSLNAQLDLKMGEVTQELDEAKRKGLEERAQSKLQEHAALQQQIRLLTDAENQHRKAMDWMREGELWRAYSELGAAQLSLQLMQGSARGLDLLERVLFYRIAAIERAADPQLDPALKEVLGLEMERLLSLAYTLAEHGRRSLRAQEASVPETGKEDWRLRVRLWEHLLSALDKRSPAAEQALKEARELHLFYQQSQQSESTLLLSGYQMLEKEGSAAVPRLEHSLSTLGRRFELRAEVSQDPERQATARRVAETWLTSAGGRDMTAERLQIQFQEALLAWDPQTLLRYLLDGLLEKYAQANAQRVPDPARWSRIDQEHRRFSSVLLGLAQEEFQALRRIVDNAVARLETGIEGLDARQTEIASFFLQDAQRELIYARILLKRPDELSPYSSLKSVVEDQQHAIRLNIGIQQGERSDTIANALKAVLRQAEERTLVLAERFIPVTEEHLGRPWPELAGADAPWPKVAELFIEGKEAAGAALGSLMLVVPDYVQAQADQNVALEAWEEALRLLSDEGGGGGDSQQSDDRQEEGEGTERDDPQLQEQMREESVKKVLEMLQRMEQEDESTEPQRGPVKGGLRPW